MSEEAMINLWRKIDDVPPPKREPFLAAKSIEDGRIRGGQLFRYSENPHHKFEQFAGKDWWPAFFYPKYWMRSEGHPRSP